MYVYSKTSNTHFLQIDDGHWGEWKEWAPNARTCGGGNQTRSRLCNDPYIAYGGANCSSNESYIERLDKNGIQEQIDNRPCPGKISRIILTRAIRLAKKIHLEELA